MYVPAGERRKYATIENFFKFQKAQNNKMIIVMASHQLIYYNLKATRSHTSALKEPVHVMFLKEKCLVYKL
jgi:hypothetical protein